MLQVACGAGGFVKGTAMMQGAEACSKTCHGWCCGCLSPLVLHPLVPHPLWRGLASGDSVCVLLCGCRLMCRSLTFSGMRGLGPAPPPCSTAAPCSQSGTDDGAARSELLFAAVALPAVGVSVGTVPIRASSSVTVPSVLPRRLMDAAPAAAAASFCWAQGAGGGQHRSGWLLGHGLLQASCPKCLGLA